MGHPGVAVRRIEPSQVRIDAGRESEGVVDGPQPDHLHKADWGEALARRFQVGEAIGDKRADGAGVVRLPRLEPHRRLQPPGARVVHRMGASQGLEGLGRVLGDRHVEFGGARPVVVRPDPLLALQGLRRLGKIAGLDIVDRGGLDDYVGHRIELHRALDQGGALVGAADRQQHLPKAVVGDVQAGGHRQRSPEQLLLAGVGHGAVHQHLLGHIEQPRGVGERLRAAHRTPRQLQQLRLLRWRGQLGVVDRRDRHRRLQVGVFGVAGEELLRLIADVGHVPPVDRVVGPGDEGVVGGCELAAEIVGQLGRIERQRHVVGDLARHVPLAVRGFRRVEGIDHNAVTGVQEVGGDLEAVVLLRDTAADHEVGARCAGAGPRRDHGHLIATEGIGDPAGERRGERLGRGVVVRGLEGLNGDRRRTHRRPFRGAGQQPGSGAGKHERGGCDHRPQVPPPNPRRVGRCCGGRGLRRYAAGRR